MTSNISLVTAGTAAATSASSGFSISDAIALFVVVAVIALVVVVVLGMRPRRSPGTLTSHAEEIKKAAAADVAEMAEDRKLTSPDAPGLEEDDL